MSLPNFTWEAGRLISFAGKVGETIYDNRPKNTTEPWEYHPPKHAEYAWELSECLLDFGELGKLLQGQDMAAIEKCCNHILSRYNSMADMTIHSQPIPINEGKAIVLEIKDKARSWQKQDLELDR